MQVDEIVELRDDLHTLMFNTTQNWYHFSSRPPDPPLHEDEKINNVFWTNTLLYGGTQDAAITPPHRNQLYINVLKSSLSVL